MYTFHSISFKPFTMWHVFRINNCRLIEMAWRLTNGCEVCSCHLVLRHLLMTDCSAKSMCSSALTAKNLVFYKQESSDCDKIKDTGKNEKSIDNWHHRPRWFLPLGAVTPKRLRSSRDQAACVVVEHSEN